MNNEIRVAKQDFKDGHTEAFSRLLELGHKFDQEDRQSFRDIIGNRQFLVQILFSNGEGQYVTIHSGNINEMLEALSSGWVSKKVAKQIGFSDAINIIKANRIIRGGMNEVEKAEKAKKGLKENIMIKKTQQKGGSFFPYANKSNIDLKKYQVISGESETPLLEEECVIYALRQSGVEEHNISAIKTMFERGSTFGKKNFSILSELLEKKIILKRIDKGLKKNKEWNVYGEKYEDTINLGLFKGHYFINDKTDFTLFAAKNYREIENIEDNHRITKRRKTRYDRESTKDTIDAITLLDHLFNQGYFVEEHWITRLNSYVNVNIDPFTDNILQYVEKDQQLTDNHKFKFISKKSVFYADIESFVNGDLHDGFMCGIMKDSGNEPKIFTIEESDQGGKWLHNAFDYAVKKSQPDEEIIIYFHCLKYDFSVMKKHVNIIDICEKDGLIYSQTIMTINRYGLDNEPRKIKMVDSYKMAGFKLADFNKTFKLDKNLDKKEAIGYTYYTKENYMNRCEISEYIEHVKRKERKTFYENMKQLGPEFDYDALTKTFSPIKYYKYYLHYDVLVLCKGMLTLRESLKAITGLDMYNSLTISSITDKFVKKEGCYDGVQEVCGNLRHYIAQATPGGRVHANTDYVKKTVKKMIEDFDACSLYPSAMYRMCREMGVCIGQCKRLETHNLKDIEKFSYSILTVNILKVNKEQQMPFIQRRCDGISEYINKVPLEGMKTIIDIITLQDYIKFHKIDYEILDGVYWNEGYNKKLGDVIKTLYDNRLKYKKEGNEAMQNTLKLMLNSVYGKTINKKSYSKVVIVEDKDFRNWVDNYFYNIKNIIKINDRQWKFVMDQTDNSYNKGHVGAMVLSYSKRIMNEVMNVANDNGIIIYYQDTDSMHIDMSKIKYNGEEYSGIELLKLKYKEEYGRDLEGKYMEQFHGDFALEGAVSDIHSVTSIFLGKKCYMDMLEGFDENGMLVRGYHVRLKGITEPGHRAEANKMIGSYYKLFQKLAKDEEVKFIMNPLDSDKVEGKVAFEFTGLGVRTREEFIRVFNKKFLEE